MRLGFGDGQTGNHRFSGAVIAGFTPVKIGPKKMFDKSKNSSDSPLGFMA
jgi:hypothetical protein